MTFLLPIMAGICIGFSVKGHKTLWLAYIGVVLLIISEHIK